MMDVCGKLSFIFVCFFVLFCFANVFSLNKQDVFNTTNDTESTASKGQRSETVDLDSNNSDPNSSDFLKIEISDALNEKDKVKFTVKTKVYLN